MKIDTKKLNRKTLKSLPERGWNEETEYKALYIIPSGLKHDSGYMCIAIVGEKENGELEIAAYPDDIVWDYTKFRQEYDCAGVRTDCLYPNGVLRFWGRKLKFVVEGAYSSTTIRIEHKNA